MFAVVDVETTGGSPRKERIIEIAIVKTDGKQILDSYQSLVNPEKLIPPFVSKLTGIKNKMVESAPLFSEIADEIKAFTADCTLVAHNAYIDYGFLKSEYKYIGEYYQRERLCTLKLAQRLLPDAVGFSLSKLIVKFDIENESTHRAYGDALATAHLLHEFLEMANTELLEQIQKRKYVQYLEDVKIPESEINVIPDAVGLLKFYDKNDKLIFVTRAVDLRERIDDMLFYYKPETNKGSMMRNAVRLDYEATHNETLAHLLEIDTISRLKPGYNKQSFSTRSIIELIQNKNKFGYIELSMKPQKPVKNSGLCFSNKFEASSVIGKLNKQYKLCPVLTSIENKCTKDCPYVAQKKCNGANLQMEEPKVYNSRLKKALESLTYKKDSFLLSMKREDVDGESTWIEMPMNCTRLANNRF